MFCNTLRAKHGVEWREGILHDKRVEFFRGKDLQRYYQKHPSNFEKWVGGPGEAAVLGQSQYPLCGRQFPPRHALNLFALDVILQSWVRWAHCMSCGQV